MADMNQSKIRTINLREELTSSRREAVSDTQQEDEDIWSLHYC
jgi:hypothetical protein